MIPRWNVALQIRQEDTIIFSIIERAQFKHNDVIYRPGGIPVPAFIDGDRQLSFMEWLLLGEIVDCLCFAHPKVGPCVPRLATKLVWMDTKFETSKREELHK